MTKISVLVSGGGANLQPILDVYRQGKIPNMEVTSVISSLAEARAVERAKRAGVPVYLVERSLFPNGASFCNALLNKLRDVDTDLVVCAGFTERLNYPLLRFYKNRVINVQPVLFPAFCDGELDAIRAVERILELGARVTGATAYFMGEEDNGHGPIIAQQSVDVLSTDDPVTLSERIMRSGEWVALLRAIRLYCEGRLSVDGERVLIEEAAKQERRGRPALPDRQARPEVAASAAK